MGKKIKIELEDAEDGEYNLSLEDNKSKDKIIKVFELMELLESGGRTSHNGDNTASIAIMVMLTLQQ